MKKLLFIIISSALLLCLHTSTALASFEQADPLITGDYEDEILVLVRNKDFYTLEKIAEDLRYSGERFPGGYYKLPHFYWGVGKLAKESDKAYKKRLAVIDEWMDEYPDSITARVAKASVMKDYAWFARGSGYANTVTKNGWKLFGERLKKSYELAADGPEYASDDCPMRYYVLLTIAMASGMEGPDYERLYGAAIDLDPGYYDFYLRKAYKLLPRWGGGTGEWIRFANKSAALTKDDEGMTIYTRIMWSSYKLGEWKPGDANNVSWDKMRQGFLDMEEYYPDSEWNLNIFAVFAYMNGDRETLKGLVARIGENPRLEVWGTRDYYECARDFAHGDESWTKKLSRRIMQLLVKLLKKR